MLALKLVGGVSPKSHTSDLSFRGYQKPSAAFILKAFKEYYARYPDLKEYEIPVFLSKAGKIRLPRHQELIVIPSSTNLNHQQFQALYALLKFHQDSPALIEDIKNSGAFSILQIAQLKGILSLQKILQKTALISNAGIGILRSNWNAHTHPLNQEPSPIDSHISRVGTVIYPSTGEVIFHKNPQHLWGSATVPEKIQLILNKLFNEITDEATHSQLFALVFNKQVLEDLIFELLDEVKNAYDLQRDNWENLLLQVSTAFKVKSPHASEDSANQLYQKLRKFCSELATLNQTRKETLSQLDKIYRSLAVMYAKIFEHLGEHFRNHPMGDLKTTFRLNKQEALLIQFLLEYSITNIPFELMQSKDFNIHWFIKNFKDPKQMEALMLKVEEVLQHIEKTAPLEEAPAEAHQKLIDQILGINSEPNPDPNKKPYHILFSSGGKKSLYGLEIDLLKDLLQNLRILRFNARAQNTKKMQNGSGYRLKVGDHRMLYTIDDAPKTLTLEQIEHRKDIYKKKK